MTLIWLSPGLPVDRDTVATDLGPTVQVASQAFPPPGAALAVATVFERDLIARLASVPGAGATLLLRPPGTTAPGDLPPSDGPVEAAEAADVAEVTAAVRRALAGAPALWPSATALAGADGWAMAAPPGVTPDADPEREPESAPKIPQPSSRRRWLASGGVVAAAALAAVVVLATQGGAQDTSATGFRGGTPGGAAGYGAPGGGGGAAGTGNNGSDDSQRTAQRQAFLACLKENGVDTSAMTSGRRFRIDPSDPAAASAFQACRTLLPQRGAGFGGPGVGGPGVGDPAAGDRHGAGTGMPGMVPGGTAP